MRYRRRMKGLNHNTKSGVLEEWPINKLIINMLCIAKVVKLILK